jgi:hypothetical protein
MWPEVRVYLELQHVPDVPMAWKLPIEIHVADGSWVVCEMRDAHEKLIPAESILYSGPVHEPVTLTLPVDSTLRVRADRRVRSENRDGLLICVLGG